MIKDKKEPCEDFKKSVMLLKRRKHVRLPKGYRRDMTPYTTTVLLPEVSCKTCKSPRKKDREVTIGVFTRTDNGCKQKAPCSEWTPFPQESKGGESTDEI